MARTRNEHYEYVERDGLFRKRVKDATGKYVAIYGETPEDVTKQLIDFYEQRDIDAEEMKDPLFSVYARRWLELNCGNLTKATQKGYLTVLNNHIILTSIKADEERLQEIAVLKKHILNYSKAKDTFAAYKASGYSKRFYEEHRDVLTLRKAAKQAFDEYREKHGEDVPIPRVKDLNAEYAEILARKKKNYTEYRREKSQMQEYLMAQKIVETMLHDDRNRQADQQREEQEKSKKQR